MSKFSISCPNCGKYAEASTGFFAKKKIQCGCGYIINVKTDKLAAKKCSHCGNQVVYDQSKGSDAVCPVCHEKINTIDDNNKLENFSCEQCGVRLQTTHGTYTYKCPVCDFENNVQKRLMDEKIRKDGLASIIKYEGDNNTFVWKHPIEDFNYGSQLIVHESQEAIFFKDGQALDLFGPGRYTLETQQLPLLEKIYSLPTDTEGTFHSEVYFVNKTVQMAIKWGTPDKVRFIDPLTGVPLALGASGEMNIQVSNSRRLLTKLVGTMKGIAWEERESFSKSLQSSFRPLIANAVKTNLPTVIKNEAIDLLEIDEKLDIISDSLLLKIRPGFEEYGITIPQFYVTNVLLPEDDLNFKRIKELHTITLQTRVIQAEATVKMAQAQSESQYRTAQEQSKAAIETAHRQAELERQTTATEVAKREAERRVIEAQAEAQAQRMAGLTEAEIMQAKGYTQKDVIQAEVQKAYAEGLGNMDFGGSSGGSSITGDMLGLSVGMAAAGAIAPHLSGIIQGINPQGQQMDINQSGLTGTSSQYDMVAGQTTNTFQQNENSNQQQVNQGWDCACGQKGIMGRFCSNCGSPRPAKNIGWDCACGQKNNMGRFCSNCGTKKPDSVPNVWDCTCGRKGITGNFCDNCGKKRGE